MMDSYVIDYLARQMHATDLYQPFDAFDNLHPDDRENYRWMVKSVVHGILEKVSRVSVDGREVWSDRWSMDLVDGGRTLALISGEPQDVERQGDRRRSLVG